VEGTTNSSDVPSFFWNENAEIASYDEDIVVLVSSQYWAYKLVAQLCFCYNFLSLCDIPPENISSQTRTFTNPYIYSYAQLSFFIPLYLCANWSFLMLQ
jgi:hypothetical protein